MPSEYGEYVLCKEIFHCTPSQLDAEDLSDVLDMLAMHEAYVKNWNKRHK